MILRLRFGSLSVTGGGPDTTTSGAERVASRLVVADDGGGVGRMSTSIQQF